MTARMQVEYILRNKNAKHWGEKHPDWKKDHPAVLQALIKAEENTEGQDDTMTSKSYAIS